MSSILNPIYPLLSVILIVLILLGSCWLAVPKAPCGVVYLYLKGPTAPAVSEAVVTFPSIVTLVVLELIPLLPPVLLAAVVPPPLLVLGLVTFAVQVIPLKVTNEGLAASPV